MADKCLKLKRISIERIMLVLKLTNKSLDTNKFTPLDTYQKN